MILMQRGLVSYTVIKVFGGKFQDVYILTYIISALFLVNFVCSCVIEKRQEAYRIC